jgi:small-conductance mechanosensitive channel
VGLILSFSKSKTTVEPFLRSFNMKYLISKYLITAVIVVLVSELAKINDKLGAFVVALPLITVLSLIWLFIEKQPISKISNQAYYTFWYVIPTLPMFLLFPYLLPKFGFWLTLILCIMITLVIFYVYAHLLKNFDVNLF